MMNRQIRGASTRLQMLASLPTTADIRALLEAARKGTGRMYSLPWVVEAKGLLYTLACLINPDEMDPQWVLSAGGVTGGLTTDTIWSHSSPDLDLILNLCLMECEPGQAPAQPKDSQSTMDELRALVASEQTQSPPARSAYAPPAQAPNPTPALAPAPVEPVAYPAAPPPMPSALTPAPGAIMSPLGHLAANQGASPLAPMMPLMPQLQGQSPIGLPGQMPGLVPPIPGQISGQFPGTSGQSPVQMPDFRSDQAAWSAPDSVADESAAIQAEVVAALAQSVGANAHHGAAVPSQQNSMQGRLEDLPPNNLLQSLSHSRMTGRLTVSENQENITLFFEDGGLVHGTCRQGDGEIAVLELLPWTRGFYAFITGDRATERTIHRRIDTVVIDCLTLVHNLQYLERAGLSPDIYLVRRNLSLTESDFDNQTRGAHCPNRDTLKSLYQQIDQTSTFLEFLRKFPVTKMEWLPALYALVTTGLVELSQKPAQAGKTADLGAVGIDVNSVRNACSALIRPDTGIMPFPMLLYFLEQEFYRYERARMPFSLFVFSIAKDAGNGLAPLDEGETRRLAHAVDGLKRKTDVLGHFQNLDYAMILPMTNVSGAMIFANRVLEIVNSGGVCGGTPPVKTFFTGGISCMPDDTMKVELMLPAAVEAKNAARDAGRGILPYASVIKKG
ncbi:MAG TPA: DUF4388 domain-containing protein [Oculatellaceae cyanobacterium]